MEKESHLLELARYVVLNPVWAGMVRSARDWPWSSYRATAGEAHVPGFLTVAWVLSQFARDAERATREYRRFVKEGLGVEVWHELRHGILLGKDEFVEALRPLLTDQAALRKTPRRKRPAGRPSLAALFAGVQDKHKRDERIHRAVRSHEYTLKEVGEYLGLCSSTISMIAKRVDEAQRRQQ